MGIHAVLLIVFSRAMQSRRGLRQVQNLRCMCQSAAGVALLPDGDTLHAKHPRHQLRSRETAATCSLVEVTSEFG